MPSRLSLAVDNGHVALPAGRLLVLGATADTDLDALDPATAVVLSRFADAHARHGADGWTCTTDTDDSYDGALIFAPRARDAGRALLAVARARTSGPIVVDGAKTDGIDALWRELRGMAEVSDAYSKAHGKVFTVNGGDFTGWPDDRPQQGEDGWWRAPGVFSADRVDKASAVLADALPGDLKGAVVDLGAGWGYFGRAILDRNGVTTLHLVENDAAALAAARHNISDDRARFHWADALVWRPETPADHVVTNPPFHTSRKAEPDLGRAFIRAAAAMLKPKGTLWLVANRHLPYERTLEDAFHNVKTLDPNPSFKIFQATSPKRSRKG